ncbi:MAG: 2-oxo acid dehydrogenase subunit E2 [Candidatus Latescibacteria bacterium]|nr:2-oxo acid dehydrogenase subunit E2 [Candidatus Latescibacterota bacterium]
MATEIRMPALGQTSDELRILRWLKAEGEAIKAGEPLLEVETDKATLEVEAAVAGILLKIVCAEEESAEAGAVIAYVGKEGERVDASPPPKVLSQASSSAGNQLPPPSAKVLATPVARHLAREHAIDLGQVRGSGPGGRIEKKDVEALIGAGATQAAYTDSPVPRHRQRIAQRVLQSAREVPQIRLTLAVDMEQARTLLEEERAAGLEGLTYTHLILRAAAQALRVHPHLNRVWLDQGPQYRSYAQADVGLVIAAEDNLLVATIPEPDKLPLGGLVAQVRGAVERARRGALTQQDAAPAALSVSNLGMYGVDEFEALVDPAQSAMLAVGRVADQVVVRDRGMYIAPQLKLSLSVDHRVADGALAAQFMQTLREILEKGGG